MPDLDKDLRHGIAQSLTTRCSGLLRRLEQRTLRESVPRNRIVCRGAGSGMADRLPSTKPPLHPAPFHTQTPAGCCAGLVTDSMTTRLKAGMSSGLRLVMNWPSVTTSLSTQ